ncbi:MAG: PorP/SprF family type IX secretion system membrane protein [Chitinophagales bacterium]|nr:PorP/SprF family type IX secretion system membrane protein [Chitinophagales bacterium]
MSRFKKCKLGILAITFFMLANTATAQDIHFTQFYASPLTLNPALTGKMNGDYRIAAIYRGQWKSVTSDPSFNAYATPAASFDIPFVFGKKKNNAIGAGILLVNDMTNNKRLNTLQIQASVAYHKALDKNFNHQISIGVQGGIRQTQIKGSEFLFESQINGLGDDLLITKDDNNTIPAINAGFFYSGTFAKKLTAFAGFGLFNIGEPNQSFSDAGESALPMRYVVHGGLDWAITEKISLLPGVIYMAQAEAREINFGTNLGFDVSEKPGKEATLFVGAWYRWEDAISPMVAVELMKRMRVGVSYDVNVSDFNDATSSRGGFEVSLIYTGRIVRIKQANLFCPRF